MKFGVFIGVFMVSLQLLDIKCVHSSKQLSKFSISAVHELIRTREWNCTDVVTYFMKRAVTYNPKIRALISFNSRALSEAYALDEYYSATGLFKGRLHCIPILVKDNIDVAGVATTGGIAALRYSIPNVDAPVVDKLRRAGAIVLAKANMAELANGDLENSELGGQCLNPFDMRRTCGSSSSGSGGGISTGMAIFSVGTDTDGSVLHPASFNGLFGMRTPHNYPKTEGVIPLFEKQDVVGPLSKYLDDLVLAYSIMVDNPIIHTNYLQAVSPSSLKLGYFVNFFDDFEVITPNMDKVQIISPEIKTVMFNALDKFKNLNIKLTGLRLNQTELNRFVDALYLIAQPTASSVCLISCAKVNMNKYLSRPNVFNVDAPYANFSELVSSPLLTARWVERMGVANIPNEEQACATSCDFYEQTRAHLKSILDNWLDSNDFDALIFPSFTHVAYLLENDPYLYDVRRIPTFLSISPFTTYPALTIPAGYTPPTVEAPSGLPVGVLLFAKPQKLDAAFQMAKLFERLGPLDKLPSTTPLFEPLQENKGASTNSMFIFLTISVVLSSIQFFI